MESVKETLEEARIRISNDFDNISFKEGVYHGVLEGAKWQAERMYSESEVMKILDIAFHMYASSHRSDAKEWFEKNKKK